ncbi:MAG: PA0069 family radical SAM protein [Proteobacteria bacterium]|nr:PA0069 family radical SAM protein [Pseudomonadota bacterium]HQR04772.1 PA0069 family radical SAM protein [Rhodocyclaceae bacterium]
MTLPIKPPRGRGTDRNPDNRYAAWSRTAEDDGWPQEEDAAPPGTTLIPDTAKTVIARNDSPDLPFDRSINPYRGCEHGCIYCFARPSHAWLGLSPGQDFETRIVWKADAATRLREELAAPGYRCAPMGLGTNTDLWQPVERKLGVSRAVLEVLAQTRHPVTIVTKSALILRDLDLLATMARQHLAQVGVTITTLDKELARRMEPRAASPQRRLEVIRALVDAGVPTVVMVAPVIPALTDHELEPILTAAAAAGAWNAHYTLLRLPLEVESLFRDWLARHYPDRAHHVMSLLAQMRGGSTDDAHFGRRTRGEGPLALLLRQRHDLARRKLGLDRILPALDCSRFMPPARNGQMDLF